MDKRIAKIVNGRIVYGEHSEVITPNERAAKERREGEKVKYRKELLQRNQTDFYRAYPEHMKDLPEDTQRLLS